MLALACKERKSIYLCHPLLKKSRTKHCGVEQLVARRAHNPKAVGSSPAPATTEGSHSRSFFYSTDFSFLALEETPYIIVRRELTIKQNIRK